jgi:hypothetical protein
LPYWSKISFSQLIDGQRSCLVNLLMVKGVVWSSDWGVSASFTASITASIKN